jgi:hypothetical protein
VWPDQRNSKAQSSHDVPPNTAVASRASMVPSGSRGPLGAPTGVSEGALRGPLSGTVDTTEGV